MGLLPSQHQPLDQDAVHTLAGRQTVESLQRCMLVKARPALGSRELSIFRLKLAAPKPTQSLLPARVLEWLHPGDCDLQCLAAACRVLPVH